MRDKLKIGIDVHGVLDTYPEVIIPMMRMFRIMGHKNIIISGPTLSMIEKDLKKIPGMENHNKYPFLVEGICSVVDFLKANGYKTWKDDDGNVWAAEEDWWTSKAKICKDEEIDILIDDSRRYESAFKLINTRFVHIDEILNGLWGV